MSERDGYGFTGEDKYMVHKRAAGRCEHINCDRLSNGVVHHLESVFIAKLDNKPKSVISDPNLNALKLCEPHDIDLTRQQEYQVECLLWERKK